MDHRSFSLQSQTLRARLLVKMKKRAKDHLKKADFWNNLQLNTEEEVKFFTNLLNGRPDILTKFEEDQIEKEHPAIFEIPFALAPVYDYRVNVVLNNGEEMEHYSSIFNEQASEFEEYFIEREHAVVLNNPSSSAPSSDATSSSVTDAPNREQLIASPSRPDSSDNIPTITLSESVEAAEQNETPLSQTPQGKFYPEDNMASTSKKSKTENSVKRRDTPIKDETPKTSRSTSILRPVRTPLSVRYGNASVVQTDSVPEFSDIMEKSPIVGSEKVVTPVSRTPLGRVCRQILETSASNPQIVFGTTPTRLSKTRSAENCRVQTPSIIRSKATSTPRRRYALDQQACKSRMRDLKVEEEQGLADEKNVQGPPLKMTQLDQEDGEQENQEVPKKMEQMDLEKFENPVVSPLMIEKSEQEDEKIDDEPAKKEQMNMIEPEKQEKSPISQSETEKTIRGDSELLEKVMKDQKIDEEPEKEEQPSNLEKIVEEDEENAEHVIGYPEVETDDVAQNVRDVYNELEKCGEHQLFCIIKMSEAAGNYFNERITVNDSLTHLLQFLNGVLQQLKMFRQFFALGKDVIDHPKYENMEQRVVTTMYKIFFKCQELDMDEDIKQIIDQYGAKIYGNVNLNCIDIVMLAREWFWIRKGYYSVNNKTFNDIPVKLMFTAINRIIYFKEVIEAMIYIYIPTFNQDRMHELTYLQNVLSFFREE